jgi:hypothetical protein
MIESTLHYCDVQCTYRHRDPHEFRLQASSRRELAAKLRREVERERGNADLLGIQWCEPRCVTVEVGAPIFVRELQPQDYGEPVG